MKPINARFDIRPANGVFYIVAEVTEDDQVFCEVWEAVKTLEHAQKFKEECEAGRIRTILASNTKVRYEDHASQSDG